MLIEWGERFPQLMPPERIEIRIAAAGKRRKGNRSHRTDMSKQPWALILGASSGFGEATAIELARAGMNIFGVHLDRRDKLPHVDEIQQKIREAGPRGASSSTATPPTTRCASRRWSRSGSVSRRSRRGTLRVLMHSLAFGSLKPLAGAEQVVSKKQLEITVDTMGHSLV